ncbi:hypothetical protein XELAEV_18029885mg [Xenopus laevis]|uniref:Uncharacterized protein n=1 Tax=Xenopus laevis TaxID=8355 RepID=A0A974CU64_XENLA|nr:hypothetical protein XELAEV_18029885mg [Xenopus laevis]
MKSNHEIDEVKPPGWRKYGYWGFRSVYTMPVDEAYYITKEILSTETSHLKDKEVISVERIYAFRFMKQQQWRHKVLSKGGLLLGQDEQPMKPLFSNTAPVQQFH